MTRWLPKLEGLMVSRASGEHDWIGEGEGEVSAGEAPGETC